MRLGDLDPSYLRTDAAKGLAETAQQLYDMSRPGDPTEKETFATVLAAAKKLGLVQS